eukprot:352427-Chlamydomonas_euryale.AAC.11
MPAPNASAACQHRGPLLLPSRPYNLELLPLVLPNPACTLASSLARQLGHSFFQAMGQEFADVDYGRSAVEEWFRPLQGTGKDGDRCAVEEWFRPLPGTGKDGDRCAVEQRFRALQGANEMETDGQPAGGMGFTPLSLKTLGALRHHMCTTRAPPLGVPSLPGSKRRALPTYTCPGGSHLGDCPPTHARGVHT